LNWRRWGGTSLIVVGVEDEVFCFNGTTADYVNGYNTAQFRASAMSIGVAAIVELLEGLSRK
jgi:hypothetical protein